MKAEQKTNYTIKKEKGGYSSYKDGVLISCGCLDEEKAIDSIKANEGNVADDFYVADREGIVVKVDRGVL